MKGRIKVKVEGEEYFGRTLEDVDATEDELRRVLREDKLNYFSLELINNESLYLKGEALASAIFVVQRFELV